VIVNPGAGFRPRGESAAQIVAEAFRQAQLEAEIRTAAGGQAIREQAEGALRGGSRIVVAAGGDGTVSTVAGVLAGTQATLGILPIGTLNHFARDLNIPTDLDAATKVVAGGRVSQVDVGEVNGRVFVNNSSLGLYPELVDQRQRLQRLGRNKLTASIFAAVAEFRRYPFVEARFEVEGKEFLRRTPLAFVGNNLYQMEALILGKRERIDQGILCLYVTYQVGRIGLIGLALTALLGLLRARHFNSISTQKLSIESPHKRLRVATDGEVSMMETPLRYRSRPGALRVLTPAKT
jgi:diacylglycerol kinase family enzyme